MGIEIFQKAVGTLQEQFLDMDWTMHDYDHNGVIEKMYHWPARENEDIAVIVHKSNGVHEQFHRHEFFFFNYTYKGYYDSLSQAYNNQITIQEGELYAGQPLAGHALFAHDNHDTIILGLLIKKEAFYRYFLPLLPTNAKLFHFFTNPKTKKFSDEFLHFKPEAVCELRSILEMMVIEYAANRPDTQTVLRALAICYLSYIVREYTQITEVTESAQLSTRVMEYLDIHFESATLMETAKALGYHPNYFSALVKKETGNTFTGLLTQVRMERARMLLKNTSLSVNDIAIFLGYSNTSNFYKAFRGYYQVSPRQLRA